MTMHLTGPLEVFTGCHLWLAVFETPVDDSLASQESQLFAAKLSSRDLTRWQQFRPLKKKRQFLNSRLAIRSVLRKELADFSEDVRFDSGEQGQPILVSAQAEEMPQISLSHSEAAVAVAVSYGRFPVGVDIETIAPLRKNAVRLIAANPQDVAWPHDQARMGRSGLDEAEFLRTIWTIKESVWKSVHGAGQISLTDISVCDYDGLITARVNHPSCADNEFRTKLFAAQSEPVFSDTLLVDPSVAGMIPLRGSVSQCIPAGVRRRRTEFDGNSHLVMRERFQ